MKILKSITTVLGTLLMVAGCLTVLLLHWSAFGWKALSVPTGSMRPGMPPGSLALMHRVPDSTLKVGDVITYVNPLHPSTTISHRIVKKYLISNKIPAFITKGDANKSADVPVVEGLVQGQVLWHIRDVGQWLMWSKTLLGIAVLVYVPALFIIAEEIIRLNDYYKQWQPYRLLGYRSREILKESKKWTPKAAMGLSVFAALMFSAGAFGPRVEALLGSNTVTLGPNRLSVAAVNPNNCSGSTTNNNNVNVNTSSTQTATSGNATSSGNTNGGSATSGSASNSNSTTVNITINNCH